MKINVGMSMADIEKEVVTENLKFFDGNKSRVAKALGLSLKTIYNMVHKYKIDAPEWRRTA